MDNFRSLDPQDQVVEVLESLEIEAACPDCGRLSFEVLTKVGLCPYQLMHNGNGVSLQRPQEER